MSVGARGAKRRYTPVEVGRKFQKAIDKGATLDECAAVVQLKGTDMVRRFLRLLKLHPDVRHLVDWGQSGATISFTSAWRLTSLDANDQVQACSAVLEHQLSSPEVEQLVQLRMRSGRSVSQCIKDVLRMRPSIERRHLFIGAIKSDVLRKALSAMTQQERDDALGNVLRKQYPNLPKAAYRLGDGRFTIVGADDLAVVLTKGEEDFESSINAALLGELAAL
jgi:hypothetical protein